MKLNGKEITSATYVSELLEDELFIYNEEKKVVVALNEIAEAIIGICGEPLPDVKIICDDINETIERFFEASLIKSV